MVWYEMSPISFQYKYLCDSIDCGSMTSDYGRKPTDHMDGCDDDDGDEDDEDESEKYPGAAEVTKTNWRCVRD